MLSRFVLLVAIIIPLAQATGDDLADNVAPFVKKYCVECHNSQTHKGGLDLTRYKNDADVASNFRRWNNANEFIRNGAMPPEDYKQQPNIDERNAVVAQVEKILMKEAVKRAGDPGIILPRRLSNTEYDASIRDLTGVDVRPTKDFPADPAGGEGFDNTGEALGTSPSLVKKVLAAAQHVADHLVLKPDGISFAPFPVTSYNERKKLTELAIIDFYEDHSVDVDAYLEAAWRQRYGENVGIGKDGRPGLSEKYLALVSKTLVEASSQTGFMKKIGEAWQAIPAPKNSTDRPIELQTLQELVAFGRKVLTAREGQLIFPSAGNWPIGHLDLRTKTAAGRDKFDRQELQSETLIHVVRLPKLSDDAKVEPYSVFLRVEPGFAEGDNYVVIKRALFSKVDRLPNNEKEEKTHAIKTLRSVLEKSNPDVAATLQFGNHPGGDEIDQDSFVVKAPAVIEIPITAEMQRELGDQHLLLKCQLDPNHSRNGSVLVQASVREIPKSSFSGKVTHLIYSDSDTAKELAGSGEAFCATFPNRFFYVDDVRGLAAGFHLVEGFFRDDQPLVQKVLSEAEREQLDRLWQELDFVTNSTENLLRGFVWFERSEREVLHDKRFDFLRSEDPALIEPEMLTRFEKLYLDKMGIKRVDDSLNAESPDAKYTMIHGFFDQIRRGLAQQQNLTDIAQQHALEDLKTLASRAYRRTLRDGEFESLQSLYGRLRKEGQSVEDATRGVLIAILMSPNFCYLTRSTVPSGGIHPLSADDLASRLSYFLWSSLPDDELLAAANSGALGREDELIAQTRRMLKSDKLEAFAREFFGQWLRYRDYLDKDPINASAFPQYTDELRGAIAEEPVRLITHLIQTDEPITRLLNGDKTFLNSALAKHYGGELEKQYRQLASSGKNVEWLPVTGLRSAGRGGLFGMAITLTKNSAGERTSPVKRGFWTVHHLLGQHFPPPPANVPELPASEKVANATIRQLSAAHVSQSQCAMCHTHFDGLGLAMENFDAIGRTRTEDGAGRAVDNVAKLPNGKTAAGISGLIAYIDEHRRDDFVKTLCRKFLGYALGRSVELSDQPLLDQMQKSLERNQYRFSVLFEEVVRSPQFRNQRGAQ